MNSYTAWILHGEQMPMNVEVVHDDDFDDEGGSVQGGISDMEDNPPDELPKLLEDIYRGVLMDDDLGDLGSDHGFDSVGRENVHKFEKLLKDAQRAVLEENVYEDEKFHERSMKNIESWKRLPYNHCMVSKSFTASMHALADPETGEEP
ncbi:hypothetical protein AAC387_Pa03g1638 [Persea americana]